MSNSNKLIESEESVKNNLEYDQQMRKIKEEVLKKFEDYRKTLNYMAADAPIGILCLKPEVEKILLAHGLLRIYDLFDCDFTKIKGFGVVRIRYLTSCLDQLFSMM
jgi:hypothetical protein